MPLVLPPFDRVVRCFTRRWLLAAGAYALASAQLHPATAMDKPVDYHATTPFAEIQRYATPAGAEPALSPNALWDLLRQRVRYVFVIYQENRSFDHYFGTFPGADGLYSRPAEQTPGFVQSTATARSSGQELRPFRIGPAQFAADLDDPDHSHEALLAKMDVRNGVARMDRFAAFEEHKYARKGAQVARQSAALAMAYVDGDTVPLLWRYADRFVLYDHIFQLMTGPSTPGNLSIIAAQSGVTQWLLHPDEALPKGPSKAPGVPVLADPNPWCGSARDRSAAPLPYGGRDSKTGITERNLTFASLPLTLRGGTVEKVTSEDDEADDDLCDVRDDLAAIVKQRGAPVAFGWYQEGFDHEPTDDDDDGPTDANGAHAAYITHHNGPQYFGYIANNPAMRRDLHGLGDFFRDVKQAALPKSGGVFYVKGGYRNQLGLAPTDPDPTVQKNFLGDDDHANYSDSQISEAMIAEAVNAIAASPYWNQCAIIVTWDDSGGFYDHVPPPLHSRLPDGSILSDGPRVPLLLISPYARTHTVEHEPGDHASVVKFVDRLFGLIPLAELPDEKRARDIGRTRYGQPDLGPADALTPGVTDLVAGFDPARLSGRVPLLPGEYVEIPDALVRNLPAATGYGCKALGIVPVDQPLHVANAIPADFNPRPRTCPDR